MEILQLTPERETAYERFLHRFEEALIYHSLRYRDFLVRLLGAGAPYWVCIETDEIGEEAGEIRGVLPMMGRPGPRGMVWNSLPFFGSNGGILATCDEARDALVRHYNEIIRQPDVLSATLISNPLTGEPESHGITHNLTDDRIGQFIRLSERRGLDFEAFLGTVDSTTRRNIKKAFNSGVTVAIDNEAMEFLEEYHRDNMARIGGKAKSPDFFRLVPEYFRPGEDYNIYVARMEGRPVAALLLFYYNRTVEYITPVTVDEYRTFQPMALIVYQALVDAAEKGFEWWNWGGTWLSQTGVYRFKKKWGTEDKPYRYFVQLNDPAIRRLSPEEVMDGYDGFFVLPFHTLESQDNAGAEPSTVPG